MDTSKDFVSEELIERLSEEFYDTPDSSLICENQGGDHYIYPVTSVPTGVIIVNGDE